MNTRPLRLIVGMEIRHFFLHTRSKHFIPLLVAGMFLAEWPYWASPFMVVILVVFAGLEPQFNNILFRTPHELEALSVLPIEWKMVILAKNIAAILLLGIMLPVVAAIVLYFTPTTPTIGQAGTVVWYLVIVTLPVVHLGNRRSVHYPRRATGWQTDDIVGMTELLLHVSVLSLPYLIFVELLDTPVLCGIYGIGTAVFWWRYSIPRAASQLEQKRVAICLSR